MMMREQANGAARLSLSPAELYKIQVRDSVDYAMFMLDPEGTLILECGRTENRRVLGSGVDWAACVDSLHAGR